MSLTTEDLFAALTWAVYSFARREDDGLRTDGAPRGFGRVASSSCC
jgi:hypothetical protein